MNENSKDTRWKYRITPINIICLVLIALGIYICIPPYHGYVGLFMIMAIPYIAVSIIIDLIIQYKIRSYLRIFIIESCIVFLSSLLIYKNLNP